jgi:hypothetical protein
MPAQGQGGPPRLWTSGSRRPRGCTIPFLTQRERMCSARGALGPKSALPIESDYRYEVIGCKEKRAKIARGLFKNSATAYATPQNLKGVNEHRR